MSSSMRKAVGTTLLLIAGAASAGPLGFFQVIGQGTTESSATADAYAKATSICAGRGLSVADAEVIETQPSGWTWRSVVRARCL